MSSKLLSFNRLPILSDKLLRVDSGFTRIMLRVMVMILISGCNSGPKDASLVVYVHGPDGKNDPVGLTNIGQLVVDMEGERKVAVIGENGRTDFGTFPKEIYGKEVPIYLTKMGWRLLHPDSTYKLTGEPIYIAATRTLHLEGKVINASTFKAIKGVKVSFAARDTLTDSIGKFYFHIPDSLNQDEFELTFSAKGYQDKTLSVRPITGFLDIRLKPE